MSEAMFTVKCASCGRLFKDVDPLKEQCQCCESVISAKAAEVPTKKKAKRLNAPSIDDICFLQEQYHKRNGTYKHYGEITGMILLKPKECVVCKVKLTQQDKKERTKAYICRNCASL